MNEADEFNFANDSVAQSYDSILVPVLFVPWAKSLLEENRPWSGNHVLELACGTGVVTKELVQQVLPKGKVIALDINKEMINVAKLKCAEWANHIEFIEGSADSLAMPDNSMDKIVCQQGFQFFPNKKVVAQEIYRILKPGGRGILSTWSYVSECDIFNAICESLEALVLNNISKMMRIPFDLLTQQDLLAAFDGIGFSTMKIAKQEKKLFLEGDIDSAIKLVYATPIGPKLNELSNEIQSEFKRIYRAKVKLLKDKDGSFGRMVSNVLVVDK